jgi:hypothetical protein
MAGILPPRCSRWGHLGQNGDVATQTQVLPETRPEGTDTSDDDAPKMFHYVRKQKIAESAVLGTFVVALCGEVFPVTKSAKPGSPVCPKCKEIYEGLAPGGDDKD